MEGLERNPRILPHFAIALMGPSMRWPHSPAGPGRGQSPQAAVTEVNSPSAQG